MSRTGDPDGTAIVYVISGRVTSDELAVLVAVCTSRARRVAPPAAGLPHRRGSHRPGARWSRRDQSPSFHLAHSWRSVTRRRPAALASAE